MLSAKFPAALPAAKRKITYEYAERPIGPAEAYPGEKVSMTGMAPMTIVVEANTRDEIPFSRTSLTPSNVDLWFIMPSKDVLVLNG